MIHLTVAFTLFSLASGIHAYCLARRWPAVLAFAALLGCFYASSCEIIGRPKPVALEWARPAEARVLAASPVEGKAIYLWLKHDDWDEPRAYSLPWSQARARELHEAQRMAEARGTGVRLRRPFDSSLDALDARFYAEPRPALPPKPTP